MKYLISSLALLATLAIGPPLAGCSKKDDPAASPPSPTTGTISGKVQPAGSITRVTVNNSGNPIAGAAPDASSGAFSMANLTPGSYVMSFVTSPAGYNPIADRAVYVVAGQNTDLGTVQATSDGTVKSGTMTWTMNGQTYTSLVVSGRVDTKPNGRFDIRGQAPSGIQADEVELLLTTSAISLPGTYGLPSSYGGAYYLHYNNGLPTAAYTCSTYTAGSSGSVTITQFDANAGTAAGTFGFTAVNSSGTSTATISNGTFSVRF